LNKKKESFFFYFRSIHFGPAIDKSATLHCSYSGLHSYHSAKQDSFLLN